MARHYPPAHAAGSHTKLAISGCSVRIIEASGNSTSILAPINRWETFLRAFVIANKREKIYKMRTVGDEVAYRSAFEAGTL